MHYRRMRDHSVIVRSAGIEAVAEATGASIHTVRSWVQRESLPAEHWKLFAERDWASLEELAEGAKPRKPRSNEPQAAAA
jgi:transposase